MIVCSCTVITDRDIESALIDVLNRPDAPIPTPGLIFRHLGRRMNCCGCAPVAVEAIYHKVGELERRGLIPASVGATARNKLLELNTWRVRLRGKVEPSTARDSSPELSGLA